MNAVFVFVSTVTFLICVDLVQVQGGILVSEQPATCFQLLSDCRAVFDTSAQKDSDMQEMVLCLQQPTGCEDWEEEYRKASISRAQKWIEDRCSPNCAKPPASETPPTTRDPDQTCFSYVSDCRQNFHLSKRTYQ